jgi:hypothetical protein
MPHHVRVDGLKAAIKRKTPVELIAAILGRRPDAAKTAGAVRIPARPYTTSFVVVSGGAGATVARDVHVGV